MNCAPSGSMSPSARTTCACCGGGHLLPAGEDRTGEGRIVCACCGGGHGGVRESRWQEQFRRFTCEYCGADAGEPCKTPSGEPAYEHAARRERAGVRW